MAAKKRGLGKGLDALLGTRPEETAEKIEASLNSLPVDLIQRGQYQPRLEFNQAALEDLASSIKAQGVVQPIIVRKLKSGNQYEIVAGERRWRAAQLAGLHEVPVVLKDVSDQTAMSLALIENIQRQDLNPLEEASALSRLIEEFHMTHEKVAASVGRSRSAVSNLLRLLDLSGAVKQLLLDGKIEMGHARAILPLSAAKQGELAKTIAKKGLSVRETENYVKQHQSGNQAKKINKKQKKDANISKLETELSEKLGAQVAIRHNQKGKGELRIQYHSTDELDGILKHFK
ncbi:MAG: ParB/RepB/Spo0J family partition protein [Pseudomonadota bacterium]